MPINKITPRQLSPDVDSKLTPSTSFLDALNVHTGDHEEGNEGVLKNIKGTTSLFISSSGIDNLPSNARVIGKVVDPRTDVVYLFVFSSSGADQGIWAYDPNAVLPPTGESPNNKHSLKLVYKSPMFNFKSDGFVKADIVYSNSAPTLDGIEKDSIIYFTDGINEPRKINPYRAISVKAGIHGEATDTNSNEVDFITACPKTPLKPITFSFGTDYTQSTNSFLGSDGFQFAYQHVYLDGTETAISPYSDVAFPPSVIEQGAQSHIDPRDSNVCFLKIYQPGAEIESIKIVCRQGALGAFLLIDELKVSDLSFDDEGVHIYEFRNNKILSGVSEQDSRKQYDSVPRSAVAQTASGNRLFYGNYVDGFDNADVSMSATVLYHPSPEDFISNQLVITPSINPRIVSGTETVCRTAGFSIDFSETQSSVSSGTTVDVSFSVGPDRNWHFYKHSDSTKTFSQTRQKGVQPQGPLNNGFDGVNSSQSFAVDSSEAGDFYLSANGKPYFGDPTNRINGAISGCTWVVSDPVAGAFSATTNAHFGTSAANPFILKGGVLNFQVSLRFDADFEGTAREVLALAVKLALTGGDESTPGWPVYVALLSSSVTPDYEIDLAIQSGDLISQARIGSSTASSGLSRLICGCTTDHAHEIAAFPSSVPPTGYFIVNKAKPKFNLEVADNNYGTPNDGLHANLTLGLTELGDVELITCIHATASSDAEEHALSWIAVSKEDLDGVISDSGIANWLSLNGLDPSLSFSSSPISGNQAIVNRTYANQIGYLDFNDNSSNLVDTTPLLDGSYPLIAIFDGEGGPGGGPSNGYSGTTGYDLKKMYNQGSVNVNPDTVAGQYQYQFTVFYKGTISIPSAIGPGSVSTGSVLPFVRVKPGQGDFEYQIPIRSDEDSDLIAPFGPNFKRSQAITEVLSNVYTTSSVDDEFDRSFKSKANHSFGIVYYDQRGRHGYVNISPESTAFVEGYADSDIGRSEDQKGRASIKLTIDEELTQIPDWAFNYKIVYSGNTSVKDFVQYTAGGAFVVDSDSDEISEGDNNIYVSLNYLQGHPISYVSSFGARTPEGGLSFYKFEPGDKLNVISYFESNNSEDRVYPSNFEFDVVDLVKLGETDNPLSLNPEENQKGDFVVLKNNSNAFGFSYADVFSNTDKWGDNCVFELRSPKKINEDEDQFYYEISDTFDIITNEIGERVHGENPITLTKGDVFYRKVAVNVRDYNGASFDDLIRDDDGDDIPSTSNFKNVYLESATATDLFKADNIGFGRPNIIRSEARERRRESSITYSDMTSPDSSRLYYSSFNSASQNFKDLPEVNNSIQYLSDFSDSLVVIQEDKISRIPLNRNLISDASGNQSLVISREILGDPIFYAGDNGCDTDPSSVVDTGDVLYFSNRSLGCVYRYTPSEGAKKISDVGASSFFRDAFKNTADSTTETQFLRVVGGYDPVKKEYLITIKNLSLVDDVSGLVSLGVQANIVVPFFEPGEEDGTVIVVQGGGGTETTGGGGSAFVDGTFDTASNYDLIYKLLENGAEGFNIAGLSTDSVDSNNTLTYGQITELGTILNLTRDPLEPADISGDGAVGTNDLLLLLAQYGVIVPDGPDDDSVEFQGPPSNVV